MIRRFRPTYGDMIIVSASALTVVAVSLVLTQFSSWPGFAASRSAAGMLRVHLDPPVDSTISLNGIPRNQGGLDWLELQPGEYMLGMSDVGDMLAPQSVAVSSCTTSCSPAVSQPTSKPIAVRSGQVTDVTVVFEMAAVLRVTTEGTADASPTILIDGQPANQWGLWVRLHSGQYKVSFQHVATPGAETPCTRSVTLGPGEQVHVEGDYLTGSCDILQ